MPILNYTTKISATKTIGEIMEMLVSYGAREIRISYANNNTPESVVFNLMVGPQQMLFSLPANYDGIEIAMRNDPKIPNSFCNRDQAVRTSWRILKDWIEAQMAVVDAKQATIDEIFLHRAITKEGTTLYEEVKRHGQKLLK